MALFIQDRFVIEQDGINLSDALILPKSEYESLSKEQIETLKQERFQTHKQRLENPPIIPEPSKEDVLADVVKQIEMLQAQKTELEKGLVPKGK